MPQPLSRLLLPLAANNRHGLTLEPQQASISLSDVDDIVHVGVPSSIASPWESAAGGVAATYDNSMLAAIGEGVERYAATVCQLPLKSRIDVKSNLRVDAQDWCLFTPDQRQALDFPFANIYSDECLYTNVYDFQNNQEKWVPHPLVALRDDYKTGVPTSSGLAAGPSADIALLRAIQELIERDALMTTWMHSIPGRRVKAPSVFSDKVAALHGQVYVFDLTPAYSPFPVVAVAGGIPKQGKWRYSLGVACRNTWDEACTKAYYEWNQGVLFAGIYGQHADTSDIKDPGSVKSFDQHAIYYTLYPEAWDKLPLLSNLKSIHLPSTRGMTSDTHSALEQVAQKLKKHQLRLFYRELTTVDALQAGVRIVRAVSPDMASIFAHQEWPHLGGIEDFAKQRYPWAPASLVFPNTMPHPLG